MKNLVNYSAAFFLVFLAHSNPTFAKSVEHNHGLAFDMTDEENPIEKTFFLKCKILDQVILRAEDGKAKRYSSFEDEVKIGDEESVKFEFYLYDTGYNLYINNTVRANPFSRINGRSLMWGGQDDGNIILEKDYFSFSSSGMYLQANRYYKNDWSITATYPIRNQIQALNCLGMPPEYQEVIELISQYHNNQ